MAWPGQACLGQVRCGRAWQVRVSYSGITPVFQTGDRSPILLARSISLASSSSGKDVGFSSQTRGSESRRRYRGIGEMSITGALHTPVTGAEPVSSKSISSRQYDGQQRRLYAANCIVCRKEFWAPRHVLLNDRRKCCDTQCRAIASRNRVVCKCAWCGMEFERPLAHAKKPKSGISFCGRVCKDKAQGIEGIKGIHPSHYGNGKSSYREIAFRHHRKECMRCGWCEYPEILEVHHIDRNRTHNQPENLRVLCANCHLIEHFLAKDGNWKNKSFAGVEDKKTRLPVTQEIAGALPVASASSVVDEAKRCGA